MSAISTLTPTANVTSALLQASARTGTDFDYLLRTARRESAFKTHVKSKTSSATGLFQFIEQTWFQLVRKAGAGIGLGAYAQAIKRTSRGRHDVADPATRSAILALRKNPKVAAYMAGVFTRDNAQTLSAGLGRPARAGELYIAHFLGVKGAAKLITAAQASPRTSASALFPKAAAANKPIFYDRAGRPRSVKAVYVNLTGSFEAGPVMTAEIKSGTSRASGPRDRPTDPSPAAGQAAGARKSGQPLDIVPPALLAYRPGGLFDGLYSNKTKAASAVRLSAGQFDLFGTAAARSGTQLGNPSTQEKLVAVGSLSSGTRPMLFNLFTNSPTRPLV